MRKTQTSTERQIKLPRTLFVSLVNQGITSFSEIKYSPAVKTIDVSGNPITDFEGLEDVNCLTTLKAERTQIKSLKGGAIMKSILKISLFESPIASAKLLTLMCVIVFGPSLVQVNGKTVTERVRRIAAEIRPKVRKYLLEGCLLVAVEPMTVLPLGAKEPIILDMEEKAVEEQKRQIAENEKKLQEMRKKLIQLQQQQKREKKTDVMKSMISPPSKRGPRQQRAEPVTPVKETKHEEEQAEPKAEEEEKPEAQHEEEKTEIQPEEVEAKHEEEEKAEVQPEEAVEAPKEEEKPEEAVEAPHEEEEKAEAQAEQAVEAPHEEEEKAEAPHEEEEAPDAPKQKYDIPTAGDDDDMLMPGADEAEPEEVQPEAGEQQEEAISKIPKIQNDFSDDIELPDVGGEAAPEEPAHNEEEEAKKVSHSESIDRELNDIKNINVPPSPDESGIVHGEHEQNSSCDLSEIVAEPQEGNPSSDNLLSEEALS